MTETVNPFLPDLAPYKRELEGQGAPSPLPLVPTDPAGLLGKLPKPEGGRTGWPWDVQTQPAPQSEDWPLVSIVTPSFQQGAFLEEALRSVLLQNYPRLEFIVIDGGSTDGSAEIIERYRPWLSFVRIARDRGQSHAINLGFSLASGAVRGWLNSDDFYLPGALSRVGRSALRGADFIYGDSLELEQSSGAIRHVPAGFARVRYSAFPGLIPSHGAFWSGTRHQPVSERHHCAMDYELWIRLLPGARITHLSRPLGVVRTHEAAKSYDPAQKRRWEEDAALNLSLHPALYRPRPWLNREFRVVQRLAGIVRRTGQERRLRELQSECHWKQPITLA